MIAPQLLHFQNFLYLGIKLRAIKIIIGIISILKNPIPIPIKTPTPNGPPKKNAKIKSKSKIIIPIPRLPCLGWYILVFVISTEGRNLKV